MFGDGSVVIKSAPGHTPGQQVLLIKLKKTGNIVLGGDFYHYPEERVLTGFQLSISTGNKTELQERILMTS